MNLSRYDAANLTQYTLSQAVAPYLNMPDEFIGYAAQAGIYVTRSFPGDHPISLVTAQQASGPQLANAVAWYAGICSKAVSVVFIRTGRANITEDPGTTSEGQGALDYYNSLPPVGAMYEFRAYYPSPTAAAGGSETYNLVNSFRKTSGPATYSAGGNSINIADNVPAGNRYESGFGFDVNNVNNVTRFAITYVQYDDWTGIRINGQPVGAWFDGEVQYGTLNLAAPANIPIIVNTPYVFSGSFNHDCRSFLRNGYNTLDFISVNGWDVTQAHVTITVQERSDPPSIGGVYPSMGYGALLRGNASRSALINILLDLNSQLHSTMLKTKYEVRFCHSSCHNNCHTSRGRR